MRIKRRLKEVEVEIERLKCSQSAIVEHHTCEVCLTMGHEPEMVLVRREPFHCSYIERWTCITCVPGSEYDRRKEARPQKKEKTDDE